MSGYVKKIAVIKGIKSGFSTDGSPLSGLVKCECYAGFLKAEVSLVNFAPLSEGRYVFGVSDGNKCVLFEDGVFEGEVEFDLSRGFAALVCFCHNGVFPVASAVSGELAGALIDLKEKISGREITAKPASGGAAYDDEAVAEVNYYELETDEGGDAVRENKTAEKVGRTGGKNEKNTRPERGAVGEIASGGKEADPKLAGGDFYGRMKEKVKLVFSSYPKLKQLETAMEGSRWAKISYGEGKHYAFGTLSYGGEVRYICYGVPSTDAETPPPSLKDMASYVPVEDGGYWVMFQDASTGVSVKIDSE